MTELNLAIEGSIERLKSTYAQSASAVSGKASIPASCYDLWQKRASLHAELKDTLELMPMRESAWNVVNSVLDDEKVADRTDSIVLFCGQSMPFGTARHLALSAYLTTTWSIYDRVSNVCGRLIGHESIGNNLLPTSNPKLVEHFMRESKDKYKQHGFSLAKIVSEAYGWPASVSYSIRNWLIHEGLNAEGVSLFRGNTLADSFEISDDAIVRIEGFCEVNGAQRSHSCLCAEADYPWYDKMVLTILERCHSELDELFSSLLQWAVTSFAGQASLFSARDGMGK